MRLFAKDMNYKKLGIKVGQTFEIVKIDKVNRQKKSQKSNSKKVVSKACAMFSKWQIPGMFYIQRVSMSCK